MRWATRARIHVDRAACAWLIRRFVDPAPEFLFVDAADDVPDDATAFDMPGVALSHHHGRCTFEIALLRFELTTDPVLHEIGRIVHAADLDDDDTLESPVAPGLDVLIRGLTLTSRDDYATLKVTKQLFDGLYEYIRQHLLTGRFPS